jgi:hypothetical protein
MPRAAAALADLLAVRVPADIALGCAVDPSPVRRGLGQRVLQQILRGVPVSGQHVGEAEQFRRPRRDEFREILPGTLIHWLFLPSSRS